MKLILSEKNYTYYTNLNISNVQMSHSTEYFCLVHDKYKPNFTQKRRVFINVKGKYLSNRLF